MTRIRSRKCCWPVINQNSPDVVWLFVVLTAEAVLPNSVCRATTGGMLCHTEGFPANDAKVAGRV